VLKNKPFCAKNSRKTTLKVSRFALARFAVLPIVNLLGFACF
jgi:hypothetical protein